ncbi:hypothetical protein LWI29_004013 [Acer saccharum]|uniref:Retrotransposon Copia-like N-terminal domain-containing protein n=1 Tax=Acer saccharum TaxID=4024 RepID=A0AA39W032_ACESA|nr:hypothetical protein LWI29_004013 [Acer saccharum]
MATSTAGASSSSSHTPSLPGPSLAHFLKLTESNYLLWSTQLRPFLIGHGLYKFVDGSAPAPAPSVTSAAPAETESSTPNPTYLSWFQQDQLVVSYIVAILTEPMLSLVVGKSTAFEMWTSLNESFSQHSVVNAVNIRFQLMDMTKGTKTVSAYLQHAKSLSDSLAAINEPVSSSDLVTAVLRGLGSDYAMIVTAILNFPPLPSLRIFVHAYYLLSLSYLVSKLLTAATPPLWFPLSLLHSCRLPTSPMGPLLVDGSPVAPLLIVVAGVEEHGVMVVADHLGSLSPTSLRLGMGAVILGSNLIMVVGVSLALIHNNGVLHAQLHNIRMLPVPTAIMVLIHLLLHLLACNGATLPITNTGNLPLSLGSKHLSLNNVFHVPSLNKNLLSVARFTNDNSVSFTFTPSRYIISDLNSGVPLFQGPCKDGLYPLSLSQPSALATSASNLWQLRLGHPSFAVTDSSSLLVSLELHQLISSTPVELAQQPHIEPAAPPHSPHADHIPVLHVTPALPTPLPPPPEHLHHMTTRIRDGIRQPKTCTDGTVCYPLSQAHATKISSLQHNSQFLFLLYRFHRAVCIGFELDMGLCPLGRCLSEFSWVFLVFVAGLVFVVSVLLASSVLFWLSPALGGLLLGLFRAGM